jgi:hypothetical protein
MNMLSRGNLTTRNTVVAAVLAAVAIAVAMLYAVGAHGDRPAGPEASAAAVPAVPAQVGQAFPALTNDRVDDDVLPPAAAPVLRHFDDVNPDLSREVLSRNGETLYLVPGDKHICTVAVTELGVGGACAELGTAVDPARPQVTVMSVAGGTHLTGIFPIGVTTAALTTDGGTEPIDLQDGAFSVDVPRGAGTLTWTTTDGTTHELPGSMPGAGA